MGEHTPLGVFPMFPLPASRLFFETEKSMKGTDMAKYEMSDEACKLAEQMGRDCATGWNDGTPMHVVRECIIQGFDQRAAELMAAGEWPQVQEQGR